MLLLLLLLTNISLAEEVEEEDGVNESMAAANDYVANSTASYPIAARTIQRILARDDKTTAELVDQVCTLFIYLFDYFMNYLFTYLFD